MYSAYLQGNKDILLLTGIVSALAVIPVLLIKERKEDYKMTQPKEKLPFAQKAALFRKAILNKYTVIYLLYWGLINFGMGLLHLIIQYFKQKSSY